MYPLKMVDLSIVTLVYQRVFPFPGEFTNIYPINDPNVGKYTIHGAHGYMSIYFHIISHGFSPCFVSNPHFAAPICPRRLRTASVAEPAGTMTICGEASWPWHPWSSGPATLGKIHGKTMGKPGKTMVYPVIYRVSTILLVGWWKKLTS